MYHEVLDRLKKSHMYVSIYTDEENTGKFSFGQIINSDEIFYVSKRFSPYGETDGIALKRNDRIYHIETNGQYAEKMKKLIDMHSDEQEEGYKFDDKDLVRSFLLYAKKYNKIVSVEILNSELLEPIGFVWDICEDICKFQQLDEYGFEDGISYFKLSDISEIYCDTGDERIYYEVWKHNYKNNKGIGNTSERKRFENFFGVLKQLKEESKYVNLYTNINDNSAFIFGKVVSLSADEFVIEQILPNGRPDGILLKPTESLFRIETDSKYTKKMESLISEDQFKGNSNYQLKTAGGIKRGMLQYAQENEKILSIRLQNNIYVTGFVIDIGENNVKIMQIDAYGFEDGEAYIDVLNVSEICCNSAYEKVIYDLWNNRYGNQVR